MATLVPAELLLVGWSSPVTTAVGLGRELLAFNIRRGEDAKRRAQARFRQGVLCYVITLMASIALPELMMRPRN